ncbi:MAG: ArdC-like ssDNA-binding domain-containing protein [Acidimicrobiales bacterium]|nr:ArdC-like ssDNA-binding domain-containing protein [Acidimicrobiales bacterium]
MQTETTTTTDKTDELLDQLHAGIEALTTTEAWTAWLDVARHLPSYSFNNLILLWSQNPNATHVAGYRAWKNLGRQVRRGETGLRILAPCTYKDTDEDTGEDRQVIRGFRSVAVFDISQTDGAPLPQAPVITLTGEVPRLFRQQLSCLVRAEGFTFRIGPRPPGHEAANGLTDWGTRTVIVRDDLTDAQAAKTTAHELAHVLLHGPDCRLNRGTREIEAESVAYLVCAAAGLDAAGYSFGYVAGWAGGDLEAIADTAGRVLDIARSITARLTPDAPGV